MKILNQMFLNTQHFWVKYLQSDIYKIQESLIRLLRINVYKTVEFCLQLLLTILQWTNFNSEISK